MGDLISSPMVPGVLIWQASFTLPAWNEPQFSPRHIRDTNTKCPHGKPQVTGMEGDFQQHSLLQDYYYGIWITNWSLQYVPAKIHATRHRQLPTEHKRNHSLKASLKIGYVLTFQLVITSLREAELLLIFCSFLIISSSFNSSVNFGEYCCFFLEENT